DDEPVAPIMAGTTGRGSVASIRTKGFHQAHRSFVTSTTTELHPKPSLVKVKPPLLVGDKNTAAVDGYSHQSHPPAPVSPQPVRPPPSTQSSSFTRPNPEPTVSSLPDNTSNLFL